MKITAVITMGILAAGLPALAAKPLAAPLGTGVTQTEPSIEDAALKPVEKIRQALESLDLSKQQKKEIKAIIEPYHLQVQAWKTAHQAELQKFKQEIQAARQGKDKSAAKTDVQERRTLLESMPKPKEVLEKIAAVLTPAQREKLKAALGDLKSQMPDRFKDFGAGKGGKGSGAKAKA